MKYTATGRPTFGFIDKIIHVFWISGLIGWGGAYLPYNFSWVMYFGFLAMFLATVFLIVAAVLESKQKRSNELSDLKEELHNCKNNIDFQSDDFNNKLKREDRQEDEKVTGGIVGVYVVLLVFFLMSDHLPFNYVFWDAYKYMMYIFVGLPVLLMLGYFSCSTLYKIFRKKVDSKGTPLKVGDLVIFEDKKFTIKEFHYNDFSFSIYYEGKDYRYDKTFYTDDVVKVDE